MSVLVHAAGSVISGSVVVEIVGSGGDGEGVKAVEHAEDLALFVPVDAAEVDRTFESTLLQPPLGCLKILVNTW
jgi:hypothetical protein